MSMRVLLAGIAVASTLLWGGVASADPIVFTVDGLPGSAAYTGPVQFKFQNFEHFLDPFGMPTGTIAPGNQNFGVVTITSIVNPKNGNNVWIPGVTDGKFLSAVFNGIIVDTITPAGAGGFDTTNHGGIFHLWQTAAGYDPSAGLSGYAAGGCAIGDLCYDGITNVGGTEVLDFKLVPGVIGPADCVLTTLKAHTDAVEVPASGSGEGFGSITGGANASQFGTGGVASPCGPADMHVLDDFCTNGAAGCAGPTSSDWLLFSHDPVDAFVGPVPVPEPASLILLGTALLGLGPWAWRRNRKRGVIGD